MPCPFFGMVGVVLDCDLAFIIMKTGTQKLTMY